MPPDAAAVVRKFVPNNPKLAKMLTKICVDVFRARFLPQELVKVLVDRAFEMTRRGVDIESSIFQDKMLEHARALKPRFQSKINDMQRGTKKW